MTSKLAALRSHLADLRRRRWAVRMGTGYGALGVALLWALLAAFVFDVTLDMSRLQRAVSLLLCAGVGVWAFRRLTLPFLGQHEDDLDLALLVEKRQRIDSDVVAALQFESPESDRWGSVQLKSAVVDYVAEFGNDLNVYEGLSYDQLRKRLILLGGTAAALLVASAIYPGYASAFFNRFLLGSAHYPTNTVIERIAINGTVVHPAPSGSVVPRVPYGRTLRFEIECRGVIPEAGEARLTSLHGDLETVVTLAPVAGGKEEGGAWRVAGGGNNSNQEPAVGPSSPTTRHPPPATPSSPATRHPPPTFSGEQPRLVDSVSYQLFLGDAWTDPARIEVISMPVVTVELNDIPPSYAAGTQKKVVRQPGSRQISVIEGSRVDLTVTCDNKPLKAATLSIEKSVFKLQRQDEQGKVWGLDPKQTPLAAVTQPVTYQIQVEDEDGLVLEHPIQGYVQIQVDRGPRIAAAVVTDKVLPGAVPTIAYGASDDYGLATLKIHRQVVRAGGAIEQSEATITSVPAADQPQDQLRGSYKLSLAQLKLVKGDEVRVTLEAIDYRGSVAGKSARSEPLVLQVTDESGILAGLVEADQKSSRQLDAIIQRQLGIGETR